MPSVPTFPHSAIRPDGVAARTETARSKILLLRNSSASLIVTLLWQIPRARSAADDVRRAPRRGDTQVSHREPGEKRNAKPAVSDPHREGLLEAPIADIKGPACSLRLRWKDAHGAEASEIPDAGVEGEARPIREAVRRAQDEAKLVLTILRHAAAAADTTTTTTTVYTAATPAPRTEHARSARLCEALRAAPRGLVVEQHLRERSTAASTAQHR